MIRYFPYCLSYVPPVFVKLARMFAGSLLYTLDLSELVLLLPHERHTWFFRQPSILMFGKNENWKKNFIYIYMGGNIFLRPAISDVCITAGTVTVGACPDLRGEILIVREGEPGFYRCKCYCAGRIWLRAAVMESVCYNQRPRCYRPQLYKSNRSKFNTWSVNLVNPAMWLELSAPICLLALL